MADTTQPAGALPEPDLEGVDYELWGQNAKADCWFEPKMRAMMAERDAALERAEFCLAFTRDAQALCATAQDEAAALLRELEELRKAGAPMANTMFNLAQRDSMPAHERESFKSMQVAWDTAPRAIPPDAREGREPQCEWTLDSDPDISIWNSSCGEAWTFTDDGPIENNVRFCQGCGKAVKLAGTSADGETQHG